MINFIRSRFLEIALDVAFLTVLLSEGINIIQRPLLFITLFLLWFAFGLNQYSQGFGKAWGER